MSPESQLGLVLSAVATILFVVAALVFLSGPDLSPGLICLSLGLAVVSLRLMVQAPPPK